MEGKKRYLPEGRGQDSSFFTEGQLVNRKKAKRKE
jgi:hypothetical protein